jgi:hypothetical protein
MDHHAMSRRAFVGAAASSSVAGPFAANDRINIGLIGVGGRGTNHIQDLIRLKDLNLTVSAICDVYRPNRERAAETIAKEFGSKPKTTTDYRELLGWKDMDAVVIATPDFGHPIILKAAVEAGKDAYVEKPFATSFADGKAAYLAVKNSRQVVQVGTQHRSDPLFMAAARQVQSGVLGKVTRVEMAVNFQEPRWRRPPISIKTEDIDWKMFQLGRFDNTFDPRLFREWQLFGETTNGIPGLWMSHYIDLVPCIWMTRILRARWPTAGCSFGKTAARPPTSSMRCWTIPRIFWSPSR